MMLVSELRDDVDGVTTQDVTSVQFGLYGVWYSIDVSPASKELLETALTPFTGVARVVRAEVPAKRGRRAKSATPGTPQGDAPDNTVRALPNTEDQAHSRAARAWAREQGFTVADRGRIPFDILNAYDNGGDVEQLLTTRTRGPVSPYTDGVEPQAAQA